MLSTGRRNMLVWNCLLLRFDGVGNFTNTGAFIGSRISVVGLRAARARARGINYSKEEGWPAVRRRCR